MAPERPKAHFPACETQGERKTSGSAVRPQKRQSGQGSEGESPELRFGVQECPCPSLLAPFPTGLQGGLVPAWSHGHPGAALKSLSVAFLQGFSLTSAGCSHENVPLRPDYLG